MTSFLAILSLVFYFLPHCQGSPHCRAPLFKLYHPSNTGGSPLGRDCRMYKVCKEPELQKERFPGNSGSQGRCPWLPSPFSTSTPWRHKTSPHSCHSCDLSYLPTLSMPLSGSDFLTPWKKPAFSRGGVFQSLRKSSAYEEKPCELCWGQRRACARAFKPLTLTGLMGPAKALRTRAGSLGLPPPRLM